MKKMLGKEVYYTSTPLDFKNITEKDIEERIIEICNRDKEYNSWKPYMFLKEVVGVDIITNNLSEIGQTIVALQIKFMDEVKEKAVFRRANLYLDDEELFCSGF